MPEFHRPSQIDGRLKITDYALRITWPWLLACCFFLCGLTALQAQQQPPARANFDELLRQVPPLLREGPVLSASKREGEEDETFLREKLSGQWFAALLPASPRS